MPTQVSGDIPSPEQVREWAEEVDADIMEDTGGEDPRIVVRRQSLTNHNDIKFDFKNGCVGVTEPGNPYKSWTAEFDNSTVIRLEERGFVYHGEDRHESYPFEDFDDDPFNGEA